MGWPALRPVMVAFTSSGSSSRTLQVRVDHRQGSACTDYPESPLGDHLGVHKDNILVVLLLIACELYDQLLTETWCKAAATNPVDNLHRNKRTARQHTAPTSAVLSQSNCSSLAKSLP